MEDSIYFIVRYIPFWAIPLLLISAQFAYIYWLKEVRYIAISFIVICIVCVISLIYYIISGSPHDAAGFIRDTIFR